MVKSKHIAEDTSEKKSGGFGRGMLIYALVFLVAVAAALSWFYIKMAAYERSRPNSVIEKYINSLTLDEVAGLSSDIIADVSPDIQSSDECITLLQTMLRESKYVKNIKECTDYSLTYYLKSGDDLIEKIVLTLGKEDKFGYIPWAIESAELMEENLVNSKTFVLQPGYTVLVNGKELDSTHITDGNTPLDLLKDYYSRYEDLPHLVTWDTGKYISDLPIVILDENGAETDGAIDENIIADNCTSAEKEEISAIMNKYVEKYVAFTSGTHNNPYSNYYDCAQYVVEDSDLQIRLKSAIGGLGFASSLGDHIDSITVNRCMNIGNDRYAADATYVVTTTGSNGNVTTNSYSGIYILARTGESRNLKVEDEVTY